MDLLMSFGAGAFLFGIGALLVVIAAAIWRDGL